MKFERPLKILVCKPFVRIMLSCSRCWFDQYDTGTAYSSAPYKLKLDIYYCKLRLDWHRNLQQNSISISLQNSYTILVLLHADNKQMRRD